VYLFRRIRLELSMTGSGTVAVQFLTDTPLVAGGGLALRHTITINAPLVRTSPESFRLPGTTKGSSFQVEVIPSSGVQMIMYGIQVEFKRGDSAGAWNWITVPVVPTPAGWTKLPLPIRTTPNDFSQLALPIRTTPNDFMKLALPVRPTPNDFTRFDLPIERADATWRWAELPVQED
jgi:hypothetical protein